MINANSNILSDTEGLSILIIFALIINLIAYLSHSHEKKLDSFLVADRKNGWLKTAFSIAVSWIWAPAIFICSMQSYLYGLPGIFWFTAPNFLCFFLFIPIALKLRQSMPEAYSFPDYLRKIRFPNKPNIHLTYLIIFIGYQIGALVINTIAGAYLLNIITGINTYVLGILFLSIPLLYSLRAGIKTSILTDSLQMILVLSITLLIIPWILTKLGSEQLLLGFGGISGKYTSIFNSEIAYSMGIPMTLGLLAGPLADQMFFQRALSVEQSQIKKSFTVGALLFVVIPLLLSILGFAAVDLVNNKNLIVADEQFIGLLTINYYLPKFCCYLFVLMCLAGLCSTLDSALCALSSIFTIDIYQAYFKKNAEPSQLLKVTRYTMFIICLSIFLIIMTKPKLIWIFMIYGALASAAMPTTIYILFSDLSAKQATYSIVLALLIGLPMSIIANYFEYNNLKVFAAFLIPFISFTICLVSKKNYNNCK